MNTTFQTRPNTDFAAIQALVGQSDAAATIRYIHARDTNLEQVVSAMDKALKN